MGRVFDELMKCELQNVVSELDKLIRASKVVECQRFGIKCGELAQFIQNM